VTDYESIIEQARAALGEPKRIDLMHVKDGPFAPIRWKK